MPDSVSLAGSPPPYSNRGVYPPIPHTHAPTFDCYNATVFAHYSEIMDHLEQALLDAGFDTQRSDGPPIKFYARNSLLTDRTGYRLLQVRSGGSNPHPFVECKGPQSVPVAQALREQFRHRPARIDSAFDRAAPGLFGRMVDLSAAFERKYGLKRNFAGASPEHPNRGTTVYLGSRKAMVFVRIYQKGLQIAEEQGLAPEAISDELRNWVRIELEFKPQKRPAKEAAAQLDPVGCWGVSQWICDFAMQALSVEAERVNVIQRRVSDHDRALRFMAQQYRSHLDQLLHDCKGDYAAAMAVLVDLADLRPSEAA